MGLDELKSKLRAAVPSGEQVPIEVRSVLDEAKRRAASQPKDAQAIALELRQRVEPQYRERVVRMVFYTAAMAQGMNAVDAVFYCGKKWAEISAIDDESQR